MREGESSTIGWRWSKMAEVGVDTYEVSPYKLLLHKNKDYLYVGVSVIDAVSFVHSG